MFTKYQKTNRGQIWLSRSHDDVIDGYEDEFDEEANEAHDNKPYGSPDCHFRKLCGREQQKQQRQ